mgnify:FL=1
MLCVILLFTVAFSVQAQEKDVEIVAQLRFNLWVQSSPQGMQTTGAGVAKKKERYQGSFFLKNGEKLTEVSYRQGRRTGEVTYKGGEECVLYKKGAEDVPLVELCKFRLPKSGKYLVLLRTSGTAKDPVFKPILIPHDKSHLKKGRVLFVNYTNLKLGLVLDAKRKLALQPNAMKSLLLKDAKAAGVHIEMHTKAKGDKEWQVVESKGYSINHESKSACILYQEKKGGPVKMKFFTGL